MSLAAMTWVWEHSPHKGSALLLLLAIADNARDEDWAAWPGIATLKRKTRLSERSVQYLLRTLEESGALAVEYGASQYGTNIYRVQGGAKIAPVLPDRVQSSVAGGAIQRPEGVQSAAPKPIESNPINPGESPVVLRIRERDAKRLGRRK